LAFNRHDSNGSKQHRAHQNLGSHSAQSGIWAKTQHDPWQASEYYECVAVGLFPTIHIHSHSMVPGGFEVMS